MTPTATTAIERSSNGEHAPLTTSHGRPPRLDDDKLARLARLVARSHSVARGENDPETSTALAPFTLQPTAAVPDSSLEDVATAVSVARFAQSPWSARPFVELASIALRFH